MCVLGAMQSFEQLKSHCSKLESTIASLQSVNVQVTSQTHQDALARERDVDELRSRVKTLETLLHKEKHLNKDMKLQACSTQYYYKSHADVMMS